MSTSKRLHALFWIILAIAITFAIRSSPAQANLSGSNVTFAPNVEYETGKTSASCYEPGNAYQILCFNLDTSSPDGQDATSLAIQFPSDWDVRGRWVGDRYDYTSIEHSCTNGGSMSSSLSWSSFIRSGQYFAQDNRNQNPGTTCHALYCFAVHDGTDPGDPPYDDELDATISWSWAGPTTGASSPTSVCSNDGLYPQDSFPCEQQTDLPAVVPVCEFTEITILPETLPNAIAGEYYTQQLYPTNPDPNNPLYSYKTSATMPVSFYLYTNTGKIDWFNPQEGTYTFSVNVTGPGWSEGTRQYTIIVEPKLIFTPDQLPNARLNKPYNQPISVSGGTAPYTFSLESGTLPTGLSFSSNAFVGTPTQMGTFPNLVVRATDATGTSQTQTYTLTVSSESLFTWSPTNPISGQAATFTPEPGHGSYYWSYSQVPGGECTSPWMANEQPIEITLEGKGDHKVCLKVIDYYPAYSEQFDEQLVTVLNGAPYIYSAWSYTNPSFPGQSVYANVSFMDLDGPDEYLCEVSWGDGATSSGPGDLDTGECDIPHHVYETVGTYQIELSVTDGEGAQAQQSWPHEVLWLYAGSDYSYLASNVLPTTIPLLAVAPQGIEELQFIITAHPEHGTLGEPEFVGCSPIEWHDALTYCRGRVIYSPTITTPPFVGWDDLVYMVSDQFGHTSSPASITLWVDDNEAPTADDGMAVVSTVNPSPVLIIGEDGDVVDYDHDQITFHLDSHPQFGTLQLIDGPEILEWIYDGGSMPSSIRWKQALIYTPDPGVSATTDSFTFHLNDSHQDSNIATVYLTLHTPTSLHVNVNDDVIDAQGCDNTHCSLREAVVAAEIGDTIDFTLPLPNTITLTEESGGTLEITKSININGPGADQLTISAGFSDPDSDPYEGFRVFEITNDTVPIDVLLSGLTVRDGRKDVGGAILVTSGSNLRLSDSQIGPNNIVSYAGGGIAVLNGMLDMQNCTVIGNQGKGSGGGAGIFVSVGTLSATNTTITGNITNGSGGALLAEYSTVKLTHTTISGNVANVDYATDPWGGGGGIFMNDSTVTILNSIIAANTDLTDPALHPKWPDVKGKFTSLGGNLIGDGTGASGWRASDMVGTSTTPIEPGFGELKVHLPGTTPTYSLLITSPALDFAACSHLVTTDQRGITRPQGIICDSGAYELELPLTFRFIPIVQR